MVVLSTSPLPPEITVFYETLCPDSINFLKRVLVPSYETYGDILFPANKLNLVPFGKSHFDNTYNHETLVSQHGPAEGDANSYEQCLLHLYPERPDLYLPVIDCLARILPIGYHATPFSKEVFKPCFVEKNNIDSENNKLWQSVESCHKNSTLTKELQHKFGGLTPENISHVPWIEINGVRYNEENDGIYDDGPYFVNKDADKFITAICDSYHKYVLVTKEERVIVSYIRRRKLRKLIPDVCQYML